MPYEFFIGRICEEFHCLPSEAEREIDRCPAGLLEEIIEARAFVQMKSLLETATDPSKLQPNAMIDLVKTVMEEVVEEEIAQDHE